jgi:pentatricopeptide repeat protein
MREMVKMYCIAGEMDKAFELIKSRKKEHPNFVLGGE